MVTINGRFFVLYMKYEEEEEEEEEEEVLSKVEHNLSI